MSSARPISGAERAALVAALLVGACALGFRLGWQDYWWDEYVTLMFTRSGWRELLVDYWGLDTHRPVYYALQKGWNAVFGESLVAVRALPVVLALGLVPVFFAIARRLGPAPAAPMAAVLLATAPIFVMLGREVRMYSLTHLFLGLALWALVVLADRARAAMTDPAAPRPPGTTRLWAGFTLAMAAAFYAQALTVFVAVLIVLWAVAAVALRLLPPRFLLQGLAAGAGFALLIVPALVPFFDHYTNTLGSGFWVPDPSFRTIWDQTVTVYPYPFGTEPIVAAALLWGFWTLRRVPHLGLLLGVMVVGLPLLVLAVSFVKPIYMARVIAWSGLCAALVMAAGLAGLRPPLLRLGALAVLLAIQLAALAGFYPDRREASAYRALGPTFSTFQPGADALVLSHRMIEPALRWYHPRTFDGAAYGFVPGNRTRNVIDAALRSDFVPLGGGGALDLATRRLFVVTEETNVDIGGIDADVRAALADLTAGRTLAGGYVAGDLRLDIYAPRAE